MIRKELESMGSDQETIDAIVQRVPEIGSESGRGAGKLGDGAVLQTRQLIFVGTHELQPLTTRLLELYRDIGPDAWAKAKIADITKAVGPSLSRSVDIALFGRMTTSEAFLDVSAAVQVAHAISANALDTEFDYFAAVDDVSKDPGAGMIGDIEFNSSTYYKYFSIHWEQLRHNVGEDIDIARRSVLAFLEAAATVHPSGKQSSFAAHSLPSLIVVEVRGRNLPVSYANAYLQPAHASATLSLMDNAVAKLSDHMARLGRIYGLEDLDQRAMVAVQDYHLPHTQALSSLSMLQDWLSARLAEK